VARPRPGSLALRQLLRRFTDVCNAVEYAHSRGVLHRDLKPGNVIVGRHGETLVVDWGLAKPFGKHDPGHGGGERALTPSPSGSNAETLPGSALGTPGYMSPEQAAGDLEALGPRSDVYSLGATLYCLLAGTPPLADSDVDAVLRAVRRGDFPPPRARAPGVDRALEAVCLKAMALAPGDRYGSPRALAEDVERWAADEPVSAYREPWPARLGRWARRHRPAVAAAAALLVTALIALGASNVLIGREKARTERQRRAALANFVEAERQRAAALRQRAAAEAQRDRAGRNLEVARNVVEEMYAQVAAALDDRRGMDAYQRDLLQKALRFYRAFALPQSREPGVRFEAGRAAWRAGDILQRIGQLKEAEAAYAQALDGLDALAAEAPSEPSYRRLLAACHNSLGLLRLATGRAREAEASLRKAIALRERLAADHPGVAEYRGDLARGHHSLGNLERATGRARPAEDDYRRAIALRERLAADDPGVAAYRSGLAQTLNNLGLLLGETGRAREAEPTYRRAVAVWDALEVEHRGSAADRHGQAACLNNLGELYRAAGRFPEAEAAYRRAIAVREALVADHPDRVDFQDYLSGVYNNLGLVLGETGRAHEAEAEHRRALGLRERLAADHPEVTSYRSDLARSLNNLANLYYFRAAGRAGEAEAAYRRAVALRERLAADHPEVPAFRVELADSLADLGVLYRKAGRGGEAEAADRRAVTLFEALVTEHPEQTAYACGLGMALVNLGSVLHDRDQFGEACALFGQAIRTLRAALGREPRRRDARRALCEAYQSRAFALDQWGRTAEALADWDSASGLADDEARDGVRLGRARTLARMGRHARAAAEAAVVPASARNLAVAASVFAVAADAARADERLSMAEREAAAERYVARAVALLDRARRAGALDDPGTLADLTSARDLDALRSRPDFRALMLDLAFPADPFAR
jgi:serine/threonine-protein kinase